MQENKSLKMTWGTSPGSHLMFVVASGMLKKWGGSVELATCRTCGRSCRLDAMPAWERFHAGMSKKGKRLTRKTFAGTLEKELEERKSK